MSFFMNFINKGSVVHFKDEQDGEKEVAQMVKESLNGDDPSAGID
jgi:hypothetical protein